MDFNREKKNSDFGLDLIANQNKIKTESNSPKITNVTKDFDIKESNNQFDNFSSNDNDSVNIENDNNNNNNIEYSFKANDDHEPSLSNTNYNFNPQTNNNFNNNDDLDNHSVTSFGNKYDNVVPEKSYDEIMNEKYELLYKIDSLKKRGIKIPGNVSVESNIEEIKYVYNRVVKDRERLNGVKFARKMLMACCTGIEFLNNRFDPFDIKLDGWSESVHENVGDYDEVFEELYEKYKTKTKMAPELKLLFMLGGSAFMFHLTNSMFKNSMPGMQNILKENPELMRQFQSAAVNSMNNNQQQSRGMGGGMSGMGNFMSMFGPGGSKSSHPSNFESPVPNQRQSQSSPIREMRPPMGVDDIINELDLDEDADIYNLLNKDDKDIKIERK